MKQEAQELINWIKEQLDLNLHHLKVRSGEEGLKDIKNYKDLQKKANTFLDSFVDNDFTTKIPESLKKAVLKNDAEFYVTFYYDSTTKELEKYIGVKKSNPPKVLEFYYHPDHLAQLDSDIIKFLYP